MIETAGTCAPSRCSSGSGRASRRSASLAPTPRYTCSLSLGFDQFRIWPVWSRWLLHPGTLAHSV